MSGESRRMAGVLLVIFTTVIFGGISLLSLLMDGDPGYTQNPLHQDLWRAGHSHAGIMLIPSLGFCRRTGTSSLLGYTWSRIAQENEKSDREIIIKFNELQKGGKNHEDQ